MCFKKVRLDLQKMKILDFYINENPHGVDKAWKK